MPIYAYRCSTCGHAKDVLQKMSDARLTVCPACGAETFEKQVTAAGFQLKGSGWYVTDFRGGNNNRPAAESADKEGGASAKGDAVASESSDKAGAKTPEAPGGNGGSGAEAGKRGDKGGSDTGGSKDAGKGTAKGSEPVKGGAAPSTGGAAPPPAVSK